MGRLSKKALQEKKEARNKYLITLALEALAGAVIFSLLLFIIIGETHLLEILEFIQDRHLEIKISLISLPIAFVITFGCNIARSFMLGEFDK